MQHLFFSLTRNFECSVKIINWKDTWSHGFLHMGNEAQPSAKNKFKLKILTDQKLPNNF